jgi:hypothetical protein
LFIQGSITVEARCDELDTSMIVLDVFHKVFRATKAQELELLAYLLLALAEEKHARTRYPPPRQLVMAILTLGVVEGPVHGSATVRVGERVYSAMAVSAARMPNDRHHLGERLHRLDLLAD